MKKVIGVVLVCLLLICNVAAAEGLIAFSEYAENVEMHVADRGMWTNVEWEPQGEKRLEYVLLVAPETTISVCLIEDQVVAVTVESLLEEDNIVDAGYIALQSLEWLEGLEEETFLQLFALVREYAVAEDGLGIIEAGGLLISYLEGEIREGLYFCSVLDYDALVWQPIHGGKKYHSTATCSGMDTPRLVTGDAAIDMTKGACKRCW